MGKKKVELKRIENKNSRQVTFSKRRKGLMKKARELSILCDAEVAVVIFSGHGTLYEFCNSDSLAKVFQRYWDHLGASSADSKPQRFEIADLESGVELAQLVQRHSGVSELDHLSVTDLTELERQIHAAISQIKAAKMQLAMETLITLKKQEQLLRKENELLEKQIAGSGKANDIKKMVIRSEDCDKAVGVPFNLLPPASCWEAQPGS